MIFHRKGGAYTLKNVNDTPDPFLCGVLIVKPLI